MIVLSGTNQHGNMLHVVLGPESNFWMGLHGAMLANITQVLNGMNAEMPVFLHVSKCDSEAQMSDIIAAHAQSNTPYPFQVMTNVFVPTKSTTSKQPTAKAGAVAKPETPKPAADAVPAEVPSAIQRGKCARCGGNRKELVPKLNPTMCYDCLHLDLMLAASRRTHTQEAPPHDDQPPQSAA